jgi:hypothetical protein
LSAVQCRPRRLEGGAVADDLAATGVEPGAHPGAEMQPRDHVPVGRENDRGGIGSGDLLTSQERECEREGREPSRFDIKGTPVTGCESLFLVHRCAVSEGDGDSRPVGDRGDEGDL